MADSGTIASTIASAVASATAAATAAATTAADSDTGACSDGNDYNGLMGARISSVFVILVGSLFGV
jgi:hypothetical protein